MNIKQKLLIIEDNADIQELYQLYFEGEGFEVHSAFDGLQGITKAVELQPDVILLDIMMPQMNGFEVLETIKNQSSISVPIIICSNIGKESDIKKASDAGADLFLQKSDFQGPEIVTEVVRFLNKK